MNPLVAVLMGSHSDWETMQHTAAALDELGVPHEDRVLSAHRTPAALVEFLASCESRGVQVFIAAAGGAAHLAGVTAAHTTLPVIGVPMEAGGLGGLDSLLSTVQMPGGIPVATVAVGKAGATNAAILATQILGVKDSKFREAVRGLRAKRAKAILENPDPRHPPAKK